MSLTEIGQLVGIIGSVVLLIGTAVWWCIRRYIAHLHRQIKTLEDRNAKIEKALENARTDVGNLRSENARLQEQNKKMSEEAIAHRVQLDQNASRILELRNENTHLRAEYTVLQGRVSPLESEKLRHEAEKQSLTHERDTLRREAADWGRKLQLADARLASAEPLLQQARSQVEQLSRRATELQNQLDETAKANGTTLTKKDAQLRELRESVAVANQRAHNLEYQIKDQDQRINQVVRVAERVWERPVAQPFSPLSKRRVPIIAVLNLKGGVGKSTITANLAGVMAYEGHKVLAIDADYQRNLSMMLFSDRDRTNLHQGRRTLQDFLGGEAHDVGSLLSKVLEVSGSPGFVALTNSDSLSGSDGQHVGSVETSLEDVEMRLMAEWIFRPSTPDVRLCLRRALHEPALHEQGYKYILIDCPPRLSTACINAVAACDFLLVPVIPDATSALSVRQLLLKINRFRASALFPHLKLLGIVANRVRFLKDEPIAHHNGILSDLKASCREIMGAPVHLFHSMIPDSPQIAKAAGDVDDPDSGPRLAMNSNDIYSTFSALLKEIQGRIKHEG